MIAGLIGAVHSSSLDAILVNVQGVIYRVNTSSRAVEEAGSYGNPIEMFTHLVVREDAQVLYGFLSEQDLLWFETLIGVNGIGPRLACAVLGRFTTEALRSAIAAEDVNTLATVPGIGKRTASRILLDLRGKLPESDEFSGQGASPTDPDVLAALQALGYTTGEALAALSQLSAADGATTEDQVVAALRLLGTPT